MSTLGKCTPVLLLVIAGSASALPVFTDNFDSHTPGSINSFNLINSVSPASDPAEIIAGPTDGVTPRSGNQMLRFKGVDYSGRQNGSDSDIYYVVDLADYATSLADPANQDPNNLPSVSISAFFNTGTAGIGITPSPSYFVGVGALADNEDPFSDIRALDASGYLAYEHNYTGMADDGTPGTWQESTTTMELPAGTEFLALRLATHLSSRQATTYEIPSTYADDLSVSIILPGGFTPNPEPPNTVPASGSTIMFFGTALIGLVAGARLKKCD